MRRLHQQLEITTFVQLAHAAKNNPANRPALDAYLCSARCPQPLSGAQQRLLAAIKPPTAAIYFRLHPNPSEAESAELDRLLRAEHAELTSDAENALISLANVGCDVARALLKEYIDLSDCHLPALMCAYPPNSGSENERALYTAFQHYGNYKALDALHHWDNPSLDTLRLLYADFDDEDLEQLQHMIEQHHADPEKYQHAAQLFCLGPDDIFSPEALEALFNPVHREEDFYHCLYLAMRGAEGAQDLINATCDAIDEQKAAHPEIEQFQTLLAENRLTEACALIDASGNPPQAMLNQLFALSACAQPDNAALQKQLLDRHAAGQSGIPDSSSMQDYLAGLATQALEGGTPPNNNAQLVQWATLLTEFPRVNDHAEQLITLMIRHLDPTSDPALLAQAQLAVDQLADRHSNNSHVHLLAAEFYSRCLGRETHDRKVQQHIERASHLGSCDALAHIAPDAHTANDFFALAKQGHFSAVQMLERISHSDDAQALPAKRLLAECYQNGYGTHPSIAHAINLMQQVVHDSAPDDTVALAGGSGGDFDAAQLERDRASLAMLQEALCHDEYSIAYFNNPEIDDASARQFHNNQCKLAYLNLGLNPGKLPGYADIMLSQNHVVSTFIANTTDDYPGIPLAALRKMSTCMQNDLPLNKASASLPHSLTERLHHAETVSINTGWGTVESGGHAINLSFREINGVTYLAYGNRGDRLEGQPSGIQFFRVDNPAILDNPEVLSQLIDPSRTDRDYILSLDPDMPGLGHDLQLTPIGVIEKSDQSADKCASAAVDFTVLSNMMFEHIAQAADNTGPAAAAPAIDQTSLTEAYAAVKPAYKAYRQHCQQEALQTLIKLGSPPRSAASLSQARHQVLIRATILSICMHYQKNPTAERQAKMTEQLRPILDFLQSDAAAEYPARDHLVARIAMDCPALGKEIAATDAGHDDDVAAAGGLGRKP